MSIRTESLIWCMSHLWFILLTKRKRLRFWDRLKKKSVGNGFKGFQLSCGTMGKNSSGSGQKKLALISSRKIRSQWIVCFGMHWLGKRMYWQPCLKNINLTPSSMKESSNFCRETLVTQNKDRRPVKMLSNSLTTRGIIWPWPFSSLGKTTRMRYRFAYLD